MAVRNLTEGVEVLEMNVGPLEELPARVSAVESQIVQLRTEMRVLHEEVIDRIGRLDEGRRPSRKRKR
jgi:hypothetical protein